MSPDFAPSLGIVAHQRCIEDEPAARPTRDASLGHLLRPLGKGLPGSMSNTRDDERQFARVSRRIENFADPETGRGSEALDRVVLAEEDETWRIGSVIAAQGGGEDRATDSFRDVATDISDQGDLVRVEPALVTMQSHASPRRIAIHEHRPQLVPVLMSIRGEHFGEARASMEVTLRGRVQGAHRWFGTCQVRELVQIVLEKLVRRQRHQDFDAVLAGEVTGGQQRGWIKGQPA